MRDRRPSQGVQAIKGSTALAASALFAQPLRAAPPPATAVTPALIEAARKEGKVSFYSGTPSWNVAERFARAFEGRNIPALRCASSAPAPRAHLPAHRPGAGEPHRRRRRRQFSTDLGHYLDWKSKDWLAAYVPEDVAKHFPADQVEPDGLHATSCCWIEAIGYNTNLVKHEDAPDSYADLLDPKWRGKIVKGHPGYSGAILTATFVLTRDLGWPYFEKLAQQRVMQVQSAADPPKKIHLGERAVMADGNDYNLTLLKVQGQPVEPVYATEGSPLIIVPSGIFKNAPNPNAARLFQSFLFSLEGQQLFVDGFAHRSFHAQVKERAGRPALADMKLLKADAATVLAQTEEIKARYTKLFGV